MGFSSESNNTFAQLSFYFFSREANAWSNELLELQVDYWLMAGNKKEVNKVSDCYHGDPEAARSWDPGDALST